MIARANDTLSPRLHRKGVGATAAGVPPQAMVNGGEKASQESQESQESQKSKRRCVVSGDVLPKADLLRFVASPEGTVVVDLEGKLPGRGLWLSARRDMVETAARKKTFAARKGLSAPPDLAERIALLMRRRCLDTLGFARRAGLVTAGFDKVKAQAKAGRVVMLLEASDGSEDGRRKIAALVPSAPVVGLFSGRDLAAILGRDHVVHVALLVGPPAQRPLIARLEFEIDRLSRYLGNLTSDRGEDRTERGPTRGQTEPIPVSAGL